MARYDRGDVVLVYFPYRDENNNLVVKVRPAVILSLEGDQERIIIQVTSKNRSDKLRGLWVVKDSTDGREMGLRTDSFINITYQITITLRDIIRKIGYCPLIDKIDEMLEE